jgi:hypothetical protein
MIKEGSSEALRGRTVSQGRTKAVAESKFIYFKSLYTNVFTLIVFVYNTESAIWNAEIYHLEQLRVNTLPATKVTLITDGI